MFGILKKAKKLSTRIEPDKEKQFLALVKSRGQTVDAVLKDAVIFYLNYHDKIAQLETDAEAGRAAMAAMIEIATANAEAARSTDTERTADEKSSEKNLLPLDYDDLSDSPRTSRLFWGS